MDEETREELAEDVRVAVSVGRLDFPQLVEDVVESWAEEVDDPAPLAEAVREIAAREFAGHLAAQARWPEVTDCDRLSMAMLELAMAGIVPRECYMCCTGCGVDGISREVAGLGGVRGYVFYHQQDADRAAEGGGVFLAFGGDEDVAAIGAEIVQALGRRGLAVTWSGDAGQRIHVEVDWRRRRSGRLAAYPGAEGSSPEAQAAFCDYTTRSHDQAVAMSARDCRDLLLRLTPYAGNFVSYEGRSGATVQFMWEEGFRLWAETPDVAERCSHGRHVTVDEALALVTSIARDDRVALADLGKLQVVPWD
ncbi:DUF6891 domain-containing protein [Nonomuraea sp. NPDC049480]|uniref:DUF6891 domain-containing protein n=1 Tax=Nonomuraea sp. NPDC049480 TaxID=3364353 RepID=UPI0037AB473E